MAPPGAASAVIVRTGTANIASVSAALARAGVDATVTADAAVVEASPLVVLPGVGSFAAAMTELERARLVGVLRDRVRAGRPTLGICLGFQVLFARSEESPGVSGLGVFDAGVRRFPGAAGLRVPQMGWNAVVADSGCRVLRDGDVYFANSYRVTEEEWARTAPPNAANAGWRVATGGYAGPFVAAIEGFAGRVVACQFHPELSGPFGRSLIERWAEASRVPASAGGV
jgi:imidazole glycerol phosphate synthase glutamine amidotransferase subunit